MEIAQFLFVRGKSKTFGWGTKVYVQNQSGPSNDILHRFCFVRIITHLVVFTIFINANECYDFIRIVRWKVKPQFINVFTQLWLGWHCLELPKQLTWQMERKMIKSKRVLHNFDAYFFQKYLIHLQIPISLLDFTIELLSKNLIMK